MSGNRSRYLLDTNVLVSFSKQRDLGYTTVRSIIAAGSDIGDCEVVVTEFFAGLRPVDREPRAAFVTLLENWQVDVPTAIPAGIYRHVFGRGGIAISTLDALIAAVAVENDAVVVTNNVRHYPMVGLQVVVP